MKIVDVRSYTVIYDFGSVSTVGVKFYEGDTEVDAIKRRSDNIIGYIKNGRYYEI